MISFLTFLLFLQSPVEAFQTAGRLFDEDRYDAAVETLVGVLPDLRKNGPPDVLEESLSLLSASYFRLGAFSLAMDAQMECYRLDLSEGDPARLSSSLNNLAAICLALEDFPQAETLILDAIRYEETLGPSAALAVRYGMAGDILLKEGKREEAAWYARRALAMDQEGERPYQAAVRKSQLAAVLMESGELDEAWTLLGEAAEVFSSAHHLHSLAVCRQQQGRIATRWGNFHAAAGYFREALALSRQTGNRLLQRNISQDLATTLQDMDPRSALGYLQDVVALSDSLYHSETARQISELSLKYDMAGKEREIAFQKQQIRSRHLLLALLSLLVVLVSVVAVVQFRLSSSRERSNRILRRASDLKDQLLALGGVASDPQEVASLVQELSSLGEAPDVQLTDRELEVARLCCEGLISKEIADRLGISQRTVETHKGNIFRKLGINTTLELVRLMGRRGGR